MSVAGRLAAFSLALVVALGLGALLGVAVGPIDTDVTTMEHES